MSGIEYRVLSEYVVPASCRPGVFTLQSPFSRLER